MFGEHEGDHVVCGSTTALFTSAIQQYEQQQALDPRQRVIYATVSVFLILIAGICAGLTLGLLSLSPIDLEMIKRTSSSKDKLMALKVERVTRNPHQLLVCLLVVNAACMEMLPLLLDRLLNPLAAIAISVSAILVCSEVVPQAVCKRYGLQIGASLAWFVSILLFITWPVSYPISKFLDWSIGSHDKAFFRRAELKEFVTLHGEAPEEEGATESILTTAECQVIHGALDLAAKSAETAMTPLANVYALNADAILDRKLLESLISAGHSRIPVYQGTDKRNIIGLLLVKELLLHEPNGLLKIRDLNTIRDIDYLVADTPLYSVMQLFQMKRRHMAVVMKGNLASFGTGGGGGGNGGLLGRIGEEDEHFDMFNESNTTHNTINSTRSSTRGEVIGIITAEDVLEELFQTEFQDETDRYTNNRFEERVAPTPRNSELPPGLLRYVVAERQRLQIHHRRETRQREPPKKFKESGKSGGGESDDDDDENENALLLDV
jgi:metal transporter CNNM